MILQEMRPFNVLSIRFLGAFCLLALLFYREAANITKRVLISGMFIGLLYFITMAFEMLALERADSSLVSLLENCAIIFVPILEMTLFKKVPDRNTLILIALAMLGVVLLAVQQGDLKGGSTFGLFAGVTYALAIIVTDRLPRQDDSSLCIDIIQVGTMGILSLSSTFLWEQPRLPSTRTQWLMLAILLVVCTRSGFTLQPLAQSHVTAERAGIFCALSPASAALLGVVVLRERLGILGCNRKRGRSSIDLGPFPDMIEPR